MVDLIDLKIDICHKLRRSVLEPEITCKLNKWRVIMEVFVSLGYLTIAKWYVKCTHQLRGHLENQELDQALLNIYLSMIFLS